MNGSDFAASILSLAGAAREQKILDAGAAKFVPSWIALDAWRPVTVSAGGHTLTYYVTPDYFSIGNESDFFRTPMTPATAQAIADAWGSILPSRRMVRAIWGAASVRVPMVIPGAPFKIPGPDMERTAAWVEKNRLTTLATGGVGAPAKHLIAGESKDIVIGPGLDGSRVAIYGAQAPVGWAAPVDGSFVQPYSTVHGSDYADYSHGLRLVFRRALLDGANVDLVDVFTDPKLAELVSDQGPFYPRFPNAGPAFTKTIDSSSSSPIPSTPLGFPAVPTPGAASLSKKQDNSSIALSMISGAALVLSIVGGIRALGRV